MKINNMECKKCGCKNPLVFFAPSRVKDGFSNCVCLKCAKERMWLDTNDNLKEGITL